MHENPLTINPQKNYSLAELEYRQKAGKNQKSQIANRKS